MASPITLSGFNQIDFGLILDAIMQQERQPVVALESQKRALEAQKTGFGSLASKLASLQSAVENVVDANALSATTATVSNTSSLTVSAEATASQGSYELVVGQLARAQVTTSQGTYADTDTTAVAGAGTLRFTTSSGDVDVVLDGDVTLEALVDAINSTEGVPVSASIFRNTAGEYQLMLTGRDTGAANAFTVDTSALTGPGGGAVPTFADVQVARDAQVTFNGVTATSSTNTFEGVIQGVSFTALKEDVGNPVTITITADYDSVINLVQKVAAAFNDATSWIRQQTSAAAGGDATSIGRDPLVRSLRSQLTSVITSQYDVGSSYAALAEVGFEFSRSGELTVNESAFRAALVDKRVDLQKLFRGADGTGGVFGQLDHAISEYTKAGGLVPNAQNRLTNQLTQLSDRIGDMEDRLSVRREALQREFAAADATLAQLNSQRSSLSSLGGRYSLF